MTGPEPLVVPWQGRQLRIRHDDPTLGVYTGDGQQLRAAIELASDVEGLRPSWHPRWASATASGWRTTRAWSGFWRVP